MMLILASTGLSSLLRTTCTSIATLSQLYHGRTDQQGLMVSEKSRVSIIPVFRDCRCHFHFLPHRMGQRPFPHFHPLLNSTEWLSSYPRCTLGELQVRSLLLCCALRLQGVSCAPTLLLWLLPSSICSWQGCPSHLPMCAPDL